MRQREEIEGKPVSASPSELSVESGEYPVSKYRPAGPDYELQVRILSGRGELIETITRSGLVLTVSLAGVVALAVASAIGWQTKSFVPLSAVWAVVGPMYGGIANHYFAPRKRE